MEGLIFHRDAKVAVSERLSKRGFDSLAHSSASSARKRAKRIVVQNRFMTQRLQAERKEDRCCERQRLNVEAC